MIPDKHICHLLYHHNCVIVPGLGGFIANYRSALISTSKNSIHPPTKKIAFNARLTENDGLLVSHISQTEAVSYSAALETINNFVEEIYADLNSGKRITIENIGLLFYDDEKSIQFYPETQSNFLTDSFGLSPLHAVQIESGKREAEKPVQPKFEFRSKPSTEKRKYWKLAEVIPVLLLLVLMIMYPQKIKELNSGIASIVDFNSHQALDVNSANSGFLVRHKEAAIQLQQKVKEVLGDGTQRFEPISQTINEIKLSEAVETPIPGNTSETKLEETISDEPSDNYYIIVGSFRIEDNARNYVEVLKQKGYNSMIPGKRHGLFMVSCFSSDTNEQLQTELQKIQSSLESQAWIYNATRKQKEE